MEKKKIRTMDIILAIIAVVLIIFIVVMVLTYWHMGGVPDILITAVFGACLGEFGFMTWIKTTKEKTGGNENADAFCITDDQRNDDNPDDGSSEEVAG